jgi:signal transduction histidine kinase
MSPLGTASSRGHPLRFIWQIDDRGRFTLGSDAFIALTGPHTAAALGRTWPELEAELHLDPEGKVAGAIATRDTWSGLMVSWPVDSSPARLAVELSGLPVFDRDRTFRGYRGFGVCREEAHVVDRKTWPCSNGMPAETSTAGVLPGPAPSAGGLPSFSEPALSPIERNAFRELSRKLAQRLASAGVESQDEDPAGLANDGGPAVGGPRAGSPSQADWSRLLLDRLPVGVVVYRLDRLLHANPALMRWSGYDDLDRLVEAGGLQRLLIAPAADAPGKKFPTLTIDDGTERRSIEGELIEIEWEDGTAHAFITTMTMRPEPLEEAKHHVGPASTAKSDLLTKICHQVRSPLNSIIGFSEVMMEERFGPIGSERYREYLKDIHASGDQLMSLVNDLFDLAKIEAGELELAFSDVALDDLTRQCVIMARKQASRRRVIIRTSLWSSPPRVVADAQSLRRIVLRLVSNAIKFTDAGGQVIVSTAHTENGEVVMHVRNTGVGMRGGEIVTAPEPLPQLPIPAPRDVVGAGLSLRVTKALTEANHASFKLTSAPKEGTLVEIAFPASRVLPG